MKRISIIACTAAILATPVSYAVDEHHPDKASPPSKAAPTAKSQASDKSTAQMQEHMKRMQDIMAKLQKTTDPAERQKLMAEHTKEMQEGMQLMRSMGGGMMQGMMGGGMMSDAPKGGAGKPGMGGGAPISPEMMERRMDMMQMMMEQMMQHQRALEGAPK